MIITLGNLLNMKKTLEKLNEVETNFDFAYRLAKINKEYVLNADFYDEKYKDIVNDVAERDSNGEIIVSEKGIVKIQESREEDAQKKLNELVSVEISLDDSLKIKIDDLKNLNCLSPKDIMVLEPILE